MILTNKQEEGLRLAIERFRNHEKYTVIAGYAGVGKSTLIAYIVSALNLKPEDVAFAAYTGKAVQVLAAKGNKNAMTLHKLLYESRPMPNGGFKHFPVASIPYKLVIVDECSMAPKTLIDLLLSYPQVHVIFCGDPGQLPPINDKDDNHLLDSPHIFLDEIMRQALDSEIIRVSMDIRRHKPLSHFQGEEVQILNKNELNMGMLMWADQVLVATNATRQKINLEMRQELGYEGLYPVEGDKMICTRNYWKEISDKGEALINGTIGYFKNTYNSFVKFPYWFNIPNDGKIKIIGCDFETEMGKFNNLNVDSDMIITGKPTIDAKIAYQLYKTKYKDSIPLEFAYGYAITTHKAQGSQFGKVLVIEENFPFDINERSRWLYTAVTRAIDKCVIIMK